MPRRLVVDAMNVIGSRPNGWWRDRDGALRNLVWSLQQLAVSDTVAATVVADGRPLTDLPEGEHGGIELLYASRRGPNAADDRIIEYLEVHPAPDSLEVVTSDRALSERAKALGASVSGARSLLVRLDAIEVR